MISPAYYATDTTFQIGDVDLWVRNTAFEPMLAWVAAHGIDPLSVLSAHPIVRAEGEIRYVGGPPEDRREVGIVTVPWDGWPAPWPPEVLRGMPEVADHYVVSVERPHGGFAAQGVFTARETAIAHARALDAARGTDGFIEVQQWRGAERISTTGMGEIIRGEAAS